MFHCQEESVLAAELIPAADCRKGKRKMVLSLGEGMETIWSHGGVEELSCNEALD